MDDKPAEVKDPQVDAAQRAIACRMELAKLLDKYNCYTEVSITISTDNKIKGEIMILANPTPEPKVGEKTETPSGTSGATEVKKE